MNNFVYSVRNTETKKLLSLKCKGGKYYFRKNDAIKKCSDGYEVIKYELVVVDSKISKHVYIYSILDKNGYLLDIKNSGDKFYTFEKYVNNIIEKHPEYKKVIYELLEKEIVYKN